jgi:type VII secretion-associated protein (TIGR03931 family)
VTATVVEVGPATVRAADQLDPEVVNLAIAFIDDRLALVDDEPVAVADLWSSIMRTALGQRDRPAVLVVPTGWSPRRVDVVLTAARGVATDVVAVSRRDLLDNGESVILEVGPEMAVIAPPHGPITAVPHADPDDLADSIIAQLNPGESILVDGSTAIAARLRARGFPADTVDPHSLRIAAAAWAVPPLSDVSDVAPRGRSRVTAVLTGAVATAVAAGVAMAARPAPTGIETTLLVEARVGMTVPAHWAVHRIIAGPGSARAEVVSPTDAHVALHLTQSPVAVGATPAQVADALQDALAVQPAEVFVDLSRNDFRAGRPVVSYREIRAGHDIRWWVWADGAVRIGIGCQSPRGGEELVRTACDDAIESAHRVF